MRSLPSPSRPARALLITTRMMGPSEILGSWNSQLAPTCRPILAQTETTAPRRMIFRTGLCKSQQGRSQMLARFAVTKSLATAKHMQDAVRRHARPIDSDAINALFITGHPSASAATVDFQSHPPLTEVLCAALTIAGLKVGSGPFD